MAENDEESQAMDQAQAQATNEDQRCTIINYFRDCKFKNVDKLQVGGNNSIINQASDLLASSKDTGEDYNKSDIFAALVTSCLNPTNSSRAKEMKLQVLEKKLDTLLSFIYRKKTKFRDVYGKPTSDFIEKNNDRFALINKNGALYVKLKISAVKYEENKMASYKCTEDKGEKDEVDRSQEGFQPVSDKCESEVWVKQMSKKCTEDKGEKDEVDRSQEGFQPVSDKCESEVWVKQMSKKQRRKANKKEKKDDNVSNESIFVIQSDTKSSLDKTFVEGLLNQAESNNVVFYPDDKIYKDNPYQFMQDVVSIWNTPYRHDGFIVLGVECQMQMPHKVIGLNTSNGNDVYQNLFVAQCFKIKPQYEYTEHLYNGKIVGVITIPSSHGKGYPSVVENNSCEPHFVKGQLWARFNKVNKLIPAEDLFTGQIYFWFFSPITTTSFVEPEPQSVTRESQTSESEVELEIQELPEVCEEKTEFAAAVDCFKKGFFVLISGKSPKISKHLEKLALVPWVSVYDFDKYSRDCGLLSCLEDVIKKKRYLNVHTWMTPASNLTESGTQWCCMRGLREIADSDTPDDPLRWFKHTKSGLDNTCLSLARFAEIYTVLKIIIFWPDDEQRVQYIYRFLAHLDGYLGPSKLVIICFEDPRTDVSKSRLSMLISEHKEDAVKIVMHQDELCSEIENLLESREVAKKVSYTLPKEEGYANCYIDETDAIWLREDLDVLFESNPYTKNESDVDVLDKEADNFFHGGTIHWFAWYELGSGHLEVERDIMFSILDHINKKIKKEYRSFIITLFHAPGGGGTTMAQRILWELHRTIPCAEVKKRATIDGLTDKIMFLHEKSNLPVVLLFDGGEESGIKQLVKCLHSVFAIILYVKRHPYMIPEVASRPWDNKFWLDGKVSGVEAKKLALKFASRCESKKNKLTKMSREVHDEGKSHYVFEFGMAVYLSEFKGISSFVRGYLDFERNPQKQLSPIQNVLVYLSLAYYYGQSPIPCQFFAPLLGKPSNYEIDMEDFPHPASVFIVKDLNNGRANDIRICHYLVAKEILEYILNEKQTRHHADKLSTSAKRGLKDLCLQFISYASQKNLRSSLTAWTVIRILTQTFIFRDNKDVGENETQTKKPLFSQIMNDVDSDPPYTGRLEILEKLTSSFPADPNFQAHLGRFYAHCRPDEDGKAVACFKRALELCHQQHVGKEMDDAMRSTLMHIYHMYGMIYKKKVSRYTGRTPGDKPDIKTPADEFMSTAERITADAEIACLQFAKSREHKPKGNDEIYNYAFSSEIMVRLHVCDFVQRNYQLGGISDFLSQEQDHPTEKFIEETIGTVEDLIVECYSVVNIENIDTEFGKALFWYHSLFKSHSSHLENMFLDDEVSSRRLKIAALKLKYLSNCRGTCSVFEGSSVTKEDLKKLVHWYEQNFKDAISYGEANKRQLDGDYKEWMFAIRNQEFVYNYSVEKVLQFVRDWHKQVKSPTSIFYLFICKSLVGFGTKSQKGISETLVEAQLLKSELQNLSKSVLRPRFPHEWLGKDQNGIKCLISNNRIIDAGHMKGDSSLLAICKGTICHPNKNHLSGYIDLDLGDNSVAVKTFYIPIRAELHGARYAGKRVQFHLAFSLVHGYEAFAVTLLKKYPCSACQLKIEIPKEEESADCRCGTVVKRTDSPVEEDTHSMELNMNEELK